MNAKTTTEKNNNSDKQDYRRYQYGGSFGGPIVKDKVALLRRGRAHAAGHLPGRCQHEGLFPAQDGTYATPYRETLLNVKVTANITPSQYLSVRYGRNQNSQPYGADVEPRAEQLGRQHQRRSTRST